MLVLAARSQWSLSAYLWVLRARRARSKVLSPRTPIPSQPPIHRIYSFRSSHALLFLPVVFLTLLTEQLVLQALHFSTEINRVASGQDTNQRCWDIRNTRGRGIVDYL